MSKEGTTQEMVIEEVQSTELLMSSAKGSVSFHESFYSQIRFSSIR